METPVVICIGTSKVMGDSIGPKVGDKLKQLDIQAFVYGCNQSQVNGITYQNYVSFIKKIHPKSLIIAIDSCIGTKNDIGKIKLSTCGIKAGGALNKSLEPIGDIGILGIVGECQNDNYKTLLDVNPSFIDQMSGKIAEKVGCLINCLYSYSYLY